VSALESSVDGLVINMLPLEVRPFLGYAEEICFKASSIDILEAEGLLALEIDDVSCFRFTLVLSAALVVVGALVVSFFVEPKKLPLI